MNNSNVNFPGALLLLRYLKAVKYYLLQLNVLYA